MNTNNLRITAGFIVAVSMSFAAGYFFAKKQLEEQYHKDLEGYKETISSRIDNVIGKATNIRTTEDGLFADVTLVDGVDPRILNGLSAVSVESQGNPYTNLVAEYYDGDEDDEDEPEDDGLYPDPEEEVLINPRPFLIDEGEFYHANLDYDKIELYYYRTDDVFCTEADEIVPIDEIRRSLGTCYVDLIDSAPMLYIRNEPQLTDYEIHSLKMSFSAEVVSRAETPSEKKMRRERRREKKIK